MKKIISTIIALFMFITISIPVFAKDISINVDNGGGSTASPYTISKVSATKKYSTALLGSKRDTANEFWIKEGGSVDVYVVPIGTIIDLSGLMGSRIVALKESNNVLSYDNNVPDYSKLAVYHGDVVEDENSGLSLLEEGSHAEFLAEGFYGFSAWFHSPMESAIEASSCVLYVTGDDSASKNTTESTTKPTETEPTKPTVTSKGIAYTVKAGDTLGLLSLNYYGSYDYHNALYKANAEVLKKSGGKIYKGLNIFIPETIAKGVSIVSKPIAYAGEKLYTVKSGDTLGTIAQVTYGSATRYKDIFDRNSDRLKNVNTIYVGQIIILPAK